MRKKVAIIGTVGLPANYGGFETLAENLVEDLSDNYDITVYCSGKRYPQPDRPTTYKNARLIYLPLEANGMQSIFYDTWSILHALFFADVLLILGVAGAWILPFVKWFTNKKVIISIDGIEWKRDKWNRLAQWYLFWAESLAVKYSHIDISDNEAIQDYTAMRYGTLSRIIEYGADHTLRIRPRPNDELEFPFLQKPYAFKVCRIEPENNVHLVLEAFAKTPQRTLVIVGNWENSEYGQHIRQAYGSFRNIHLLDPIYDQQKLDVLRGNAQFYVHGHSAGGTNPSLVEAMHLGLPIVAYGVSYNKVTTENRALYFHNQEELTDLVRETSTFEFRKLGQHMREIAERRYTWRLITQKYKLLIEEALAAESKTPVVSTVAKVEQRSLYELEAAHLAYQETFFTQR